MKSICLIFFLFGSLLTYADSSKEDKILTCSLVGEDREVTLVKYIWDRGDEVEHGLFMRNGYRDLYSTRSDEDLVVDITDDGFEIQGSSRVYFDTDGNVSFPDNYYTEDIETFTYSSKSKTAVQVSESLTKKWVWSKPVVNEKMTQYFENCKEHYEGKPDLKF